MCTRVLFVHDLQGDGSTHSAKCGMMAIRVGRSRGLEISHFFSYVHILTIHTFSGDICFLHRHVVLGDRLNSRMSDHLVVC